MLTPHLLRRVAVTSVFGLALILGDRTQASAQQPWTGVGGDEARAVIATADGETMLAPHATSGDGRYVVFHSVRTLLPSDTNGAADVFLRDRHTGELTRVSVATSGEEANGASSYPSISRNGRHIIFSSCATNLVASDTNGLCDVFVHDREQGTTVRVNLGPSGEEAEAMWNWTVFSLSTDGRYVAFGAGFGSSNGLTQAWFRDRDSDVDGVFDEPEDTTTTRISEPMVDGEAIITVETSVVSGDGRWIAYTAGAMDTSSNWLGFRLFLHDRNTSTTVRVDRHPFAEGEYHSSSPDFSDSGELVYFTSVPYLDPEDTDGAYDVYVVNLATLQHTHIQQTHETDPYHWYEHAQYPAISADGRYVVFQGYGISEHRDVYAVDRQTGASYTINLAADGSLDPTGYLPTFGIPSISADGASIAFEGTAAILANGQGYNGVFVATAVALSPTEIDASLEFGTYPFNVEVPAGVAWTLNWDPSTGLDTVTPASGAGPTTVEVTVLENYTNEDRSHVITLGSEQLVIRQNIPLTIEWVSPSDGFVAGGEGIMIMGTGFKEGATVTFGGVPGIDPEYWYSDSLFVIAPPHMAGAVDVVVTNPDGPSTTLESGYTYIDDTPPVVTPIFTGTLGANGWYTSNVLVQWSVVDDGSAITEQYCDDLNVIYDTESFVAGCSATSGGGETQTEVYVNRDATPPVIDMNGPQFTFYVGEAATMDFTCHDSTSGVATCSGSALDTTAPGEFPFTITSTDLAGNQSSQAFIYVVLEKLTPSVTWAEPSPIIEGAVLGVAQLNATASVPGTFVYTPAAGTAPGAGAHTLSTTFTPTDTVTYNTVTRTVTLTVKTVPILTWNTPAPIAYPSTIAGALNATANVAGSLVYNPPAGTTLNAGTHTLSVTFTPSDGEAYTTATASVTLQVLKGNPGLAWAPIGSIIYGTPLGAGQLTATATAPGTLAYAPPAGTVLPAGNHTLSVTFTPANPDNYESASQTKSLYIQTQPVSIVWGWPANIAWGTPLGPQQQNAVTNQPGTFTYDPAPGAILGPGVHPLDVTFTPDDANYAISSTYVWLTVTRATPVVTWNTPAPIVYGTVLGAAQLNATASVAGGFAYFPAGGNTLGAGTHTLNLTFLPTDSAHYASVESTVILVVERRTPVITWSDPAPITYGTALGATQNNATADVSGGSFQYSQPNGIVLNAGSGQTLTVTYSMGSPNYNDATTSASIDVVTAVPSITWANPASIVYGTAIGVAQLNASSGVAGTFGYSPAAGTVLGAGSHTLSATFTPSDSVNYAATSAAVTIQVAKASTSVSWTAPSSMTYGTALGGSQLNATASVAGSFGYSPAAGTVLNAGTQTLSVTFTPSDAANYNGASGSVNIVVGKATPTLTWSNPAGITYGMALSGTQLNATASVAAGSFAYSPAAGVVPGAGTQTLSVTFTPTDAANYETASTTRSIVVAKKALTVTTVNATKVFGQALPAFAISGSGFVNGDTAASLSGTPSFSTAATATSAPGNYTVTPSGVTSANYSITFAAGTLTITKANTTLTLTSSPSPSINNQTVTLRATVAAVAPGTGTPTGTVQFRDNGVLLGTATLVNGVATFNKSFKRGSHPLTATYAATTNFNGSSGAKTHQVN